MENRKSLIADYSTESNVSVGHVRGFDHAMTEAVIEYQGPRNGWVDDWRNRAIVRLGVVLRVVGGELPGWVDKITKPVSACILDLILIDEAELSKSGPRRHIPNLASQYRVAVVGGEQRALSDPIWRELPRTDIVVFTESPYVNVVGRCLSDLATSVRIASVSWTDVVKLAQPQGCQAVFARAWVIPGKDEQTALYARQTLLSISEHVCVHGAILFQSLSQKDSSTYELSDLDRMSETVFAEGFTHDRIVTGAWDREDTAVALIVFTS